MDCTEERRQSLGILSGCEWNLMEELVIDNLSYL